MLVPNENNPYMIWAAGDVSNELFDLQHESERATSVRAPERKKLRPHITLEYIKCTKWRQLCIDEECLTVDISVRIPIPVSSVTVFEGIMENKNTCTFRWRNVRWEVHRYINL